MKIKLNVVLVLLFSALFFQGCNTDSSENPRAYAEGKVVSAAVNYNTFFLRILSDNVIVAETMLESGGGFKVSGPIGNSGFSLISTDKIKSFNTEKSGLSLSNDGFKIDVPAGITYIKFNEIVLEK